MGFEPATSQSGATSPEIHVNTCWISPWIFMYFDQSGRGLESSYRSFSCSQKFSRFIMYLTERAVCSKYIVEIRPPSLCRSLQIIYKWKIRVCRVECRINHQYRDEDPGWDIKANSDFSWLFYWPIWCFTSRNCNKINGVFSFTFLQIISRLYLYHRNGCERRGGSRGVNGLVGNGLCTGNWSGDDRFLNNIFFFFSWQVIYKWANQRLHRTLRSVNTFAWIHAYNLGFRLYGF